MNYLYQVIVLKNIYIDLQIIYIHFKYILLCLLLYRLLNILKTTII